MNSTIVPFHCRDFVLNFALSLKPSRATTAHFPSPQRLGNLLRWRNWHPHPEKGDSKE